MEDYTYSTPQGYGDTFYIYAYDSTTLPLVSNVNYFNQRVNIFDGDFVLRWWKGCDLYSNIANGIQIRDKLQNQFYSDQIMPFQQGGNLLSQYMATGWPVCPEKWYPDSGYIGFDLYGALPNVAPNNVSGVGQLAFYGVRRRKGYINDPQTYTNPGYNKEYQLHTSVVMPAGWSSTSGGILYKVPVQDFDFEMRRADGFVNGGGAGHDSGSILDELGSGTNYVAVAAGPQVPAIQVIIQRAGPLDPLSITVVGTIITVNVLFNGATNNNQVLALIAGTPAAAALVNGSLQQGSGGPAGTVSAARGATTLFGAMGSGGGYAGLDFGSYKILLLDQNKVQVSNVPILFSNFFHTPNNAVNQNAQSSAASVPKNFWPTPPMTYRVNSAIQFYLYSTSATPLAGDITFDITFSGIRRYPCK